MTIRPLEPTDLPHLGALAAESVELLGHAVDLPGWIGVPSGGDAHAWVDARGAVRLVPATRARCRHVGTIELVARDDGAELLAAAVALADGWTPLDRLDLELPAAHPAVSAALALGFEVETTRPGRLPDGRDAVVLGRLRPGFVPRPLPPPPVLPARHRRVLGATTWRRVEERDMPAVQAMSVAPTFVFGTLQSPSSSVDYYLQRHRKARPEDALHLLFSGDEPVGLGGVHPTGVPGVCMVGMGVASEWQGCGAGRVILEHLVATAGERGHRRVELDVYADNVRARRLYESVGFVEEGKRRFDAIRDGGHASSVEMARPTRA